jgi:predicted secreted protein
MEYIAIEVINGKQEFSVFNTSEEILKDQVSRNLIVDYILRDRTKNYQIVDNKIVEK